MGEAVVPVAEAVLAVMQHVGSIYDMGLLVRTRVGQVGRARLAGLFLHWWFLLPGFGLKLVGNPEKFCLHGLFFG